MVCSAVRGWDISYSERVDQLFGDGISAIPKEWISCSGVGYQLFGRSGSAVQCSWKDKKRLVMFPTQLYCFNYKLFSRPLLVISQK
jgi:hypothetical protein